MQSGRSPALSNLRTSTIEGGASFISFAISLMAYLSACTSLGISGRLNTTIFLFLRSRSKASLTASPIDCWLELPSCMLEFPLVNASRGIPAGKCITGNSLLCHRGCQGFLRRFMSRLYC